MLRRHLLAALAPDMGKSILVHEHILVDFVGADAIGPGRYDAEEAFRVALPKLKEIRALGCRRLLECTPNYLGRDPKLLRRLARATGLEIWTNTGLYGAVDFKFLPAYAKTETAEQLAQRWIAEWRAGAVHQDWGEQGSATSAGSKAGGGRDSDGEDDRVDDGGAHGRRTGGAGSTRDGAGERPRREQVGVGTRAE